MESLLKVNYGSFKIILIDNGSKEKEGKKLEELFPEIHLIENARNLGFTGGNNLGIKLALKEGFDQILLLNNDTVVEPNFLSKLSRFSLEHPEYGAVQPIIYSMENRRKVWSAGGKWNNLFSRAITLNTSKNSYPEKIDWVTGCAILVRTDVIKKVGLLDDSFFAYFEDVDWSLRMKKAGYSLGLCSGSIVYHEAGASSKDNSKEGTLSPRVFYLHCRNQFILIRKHSSWFNYFPSIGYHGFRFLLWIIYFLLRGRPLKANSVLNGSFAGFFVNK
ncbi:glycosyltransferase family 2 protein [Algoriphagus sediminis]|uniref:glycosyltransferase family 2 protein n=1 Tax=Algoriphagus sediminis TaxID=3057113 RepID=UPI0025AF153F|nr:glycosyltransferase family 2 protein [Algoriphagus sediminis]